MEEFEDNLEQNENENNANAGDIPTDENNVPEGVVEDDVDIRQGP